ncbi:MAG: hypothetical protein HFE77_07385 [Clostridiales bacterium]|nr:hypothetical protein [Clostridiales bacterium]
MKETVKKTKFFIGLALLAQSFTFIAFFFALWRKKRSLAGTFLAIGAAGGISGAYLVYKNHKEIQREQKILAAMDAFCEDTDDYIFDDEWVDLRDREEAADENAQDGMEDVQESAE